MADPNYNLFGQRYNEHEWAITFNNVRDKYHANERAGIYRNLSFKQKIRLAVFGVVSTYEVSRYLVTTGYSRLANYISSSYTTPEKAEAPQEPTISPADNRLGMDPNDSIFGNESDDSFHTANDQSFSNSPPTVKMDNTKALTGQQSSDNGNKATQETPVNYKIPPEIKLIHDTHTVTLPLRFFVSGVTKFNEALDLRIFMNSLSSIFATFGHADPPTNVVINTKNVGAPFAKGWYRTKIPCSSKLASASDPPLTSVPLPNDPVEYLPFEEPNLSRWTTTKYRFPFEMTASDINGIIAENRAWWYRMYKYYHIMKCDYEIQIENCGLREGADIIVGIGKNASSATRTDDVFPLNSKFTDARAWPGISFQTIRSTGDKDSGDRFHIISGTHMNGSVKRLVNNDEDVNTWVDVSIGVPTLREDLHLMFWPAPFNTITEAKGAAGSATAGASTVNYTNTAQTCFNMAVTLKYTAQFKDPFKKFRFKQRADVAGATETWKIPDDQNQSATVNTSNVV